MQPSSNPVPETLLGFAAFFVVLWLGIAGLLSLVGGWHGLAQTYGAPDGFRLSPADRFRARSIQLRHLLLPASYNGCMTIGVTSRGLYLVPMFLFRFFHPALLVPWQDVITIRAAHFLWWRWIELDMRGSDTELRLYGSIGELVRSKWQTQTGRSAA